MLMLNATSTKLRVALDQVAGDDQLLNLRSTLVNAHRASLTVKLLNDMATRHALTAQLLNCTVHDSTSRFATRQFCHAGLIGAAFPTNIVRPCRPINQQG